MTIVDRSPEAMTTRARVYLGASGFRHSLLGVFLIVTPWLFGAALFVPIFNTLPLLVWGIVCLFTGMVCTLSWIMRNADLARVGMVLSASITLVLAAGLTIGLVEVWSMWIDKVGFDTAWMLFSNREERYPLALIPLAAAPPSPFLTLVMIAVAVKDYAVCAQPMRVALEEGTRKQPLLKRLTARA